MTLVMVHAQDHLMTSILAKELIAELIAIYRAQPLHALRLARPDALAGPDSPRSLCYILE